MPLRALIVLIPLVLLFAGCEPATEEQVAVEEQVAEACEVVLERTPISRAVRESSGVEISRRNPGLFWTHNDSGWDEQLFGVSESGELLGSVRVQGASNRDWEDIAIAPCGTGHCLYIGEIGDNEGRYDSIVVYRIPEPSPSDSVSAPAERFPMAYEDGPRDAEGLIVLPGGELYVVTKGREGAVAIYRYPMPLREGSMATLERLVEIGPADREYRDLVTGAASSPNGRWIALRTYQELSLYRAEALLGGDTRPALVYDLSELGEPQGEAVAMDDRGRVVLTSEGGFADAPGYMAILQCRLPD